MTVGNAIWRGVKSVLYELLPLHPAYAYKQLVSLKRISIETVRILSPQLSVAVVYLAKATARVSLRFWLTLAVWVAVWNLFIYIEFGSFFIMISLFASIFLNLGEKKKGDLSAYSVFNKGFTTLLGQSTGQQFDNEIRHKSYEEDDNDDPADDARANENRVVGDAPRRRGKKARRTYEARMDRRNRENEQLETFEEFLGMD